MESNKIKSVICVVALLLSGIFFTACNTVHPQASSVDVSSLHRLYDMTPISATNPVVAEVKDCGIEIPVSEFRAYVDAMPDTMPAINGTNRPPLTLDQKRAALDRLVNEHFLMWAGYQQKADQTANIAQLLETTKAMLMRETLLNQEVGAKAKTPAEYRRLANALRDKIFDQTKITVSNEAYDQLKATAELLKITSATNFVLRDSVLAGISQLSPTVRDNVFARCKIGFVTTGNVLSFYVNIPPDQRPDLETQEGISEILKRMLGNELLTEEARKRGLENAPVVLEKMQLNRNMMVRMFVLNQIAAESVARTQAPGFGTAVRQWYQDHLKDRYTYKDANGKEQVVSFDQRRGSIEDDYMDNFREELRAEHIQAMRKDHKVEVDENVLGKIIL